MCRILKVKAKLGLLRKHYSVVTPGQWGSGVPYSVCLPPCRRNKNVPRCGAYYLPWLFYKTGRFYEGFLAGLFSRRPAKPHAARAGFSFKLHWAVYCKQFKNAFLSPRNAFYTFYCRAANAAALRHAGFFVFCRCVAQPAAFCKTGATTF